jgi:NAD-dependent glycerol-3-phosphate dehydrogenase N-terminus
MFQRRSALLRSTSPVPWRFDKAFLLFIIFPLRSQYGFCTQKSAITISQSNPDPYQLKGVLKQLKGHVKSSAVGVSLIKGLDVGPNGPILLSQMIQTELDLRQEVAVVMGANVASEVAMVRVDQSAYDSNGATK